MRLKQNISYSISELSAVLGKWMKPRYGLRILMYHSISAKRLSDQSNDPLGLYTIHPELFKTQIQTLIENKIFSFVNFSECYKTIDDKNQSLAITFDDGYKDNLLIAAPILIDVGIPFTVFITSDPIRKRKADFLTPEDIQELSKLPGVEIGTHGKTHSPLTSLSSSDLIKELNGSKKYLEDVISKKINAISYPHGAFNSKVRKVVLDTGYELGGSSIFGVNKVDADPLSLKRTVIMSMDTKRRFEQKIKGAWDWYGWSEPKYRKLGRFFGKV